MESPYLSSDFVYTTQRPFIIESVSRDDLDVTYM